MIVTSPIAVAPVYHSCRARNRSEMWLKTQEGQDNTHIGLEYSRWPLIAAIRVSRYCRRTIEASPYAT